MLRTLVAFANTVGGKLLIGVEDGTHAVCGVADPLLLEERLASLIADSIEPRLVPNLEILPVFHELSLIEQWGSGIQRMTATCARRKTIMMTIASQARRESPLSFSTHAFEIERFWRFQP